MAYCSWCFASCTFYGSCNTALSVGYQADTHSEAGTLKVGSSYTGRIQAFSEGGRILYFSPPPPPPFSPSFSPPPPPFAPCLLPLTRAPGPSPL
jgi:hypothetical protein